MEKTLLSILMLLFGMSMSHAQTQFLGEYIDKTPPAWYHWIDWDNPNYLDVIRKIDSFKTTPAAYKEQLKNEKDEEFERNPYEMVFQRWYMDNQHFIQPDGTYVQNPEAYKAKLAKELAQAQSNASSKTTGASNWTNIGPTQNYGNGKATQNLANVYEIIATPNYPHILYCGTENGALFKSIDKGISWYSVGDNVKQSNCSGLAVSPNNPKEVYWAQGSMVIYRSLNGGRTWTLLSNFPNTRANRIFVLANNRVIAGCTDGKVYYSNDQGNTWTKSGGLNAQSQISDLAVMPGNENCVYASTQNRTTLRWELYRSINYGATFTKMNTNPNFTAYSSRMTVCPSNPNIVYVLALGIGGHFDDNFVSPKLYYSNDAGVTWSLRCNFDALGQYSSTGLTNGQGYYDLDIEVNPNNPNMLLAGTTTAWTSTDGGVTWTPLGGYYGYDKSLHPDIQSIRAVGNDTYITTDGGISHSPNFFQDPSQSSLRQYGITSPGFWGFDMGWKNDVIVGGRYHMDNASMYDKYVPAKASISIGGGESPAGDVVELVQDTAIMGIFSNKGWIYMPTEIKKGVGYKYTSYRNSLYPSRYFYGLRCADFMQHPWYCNTFYLGNQNKFYRSQDMGTTYEILDTFASNVLGFDISRTNPNIVFLSTEFNGLFKSSNGGKSFNPVNLPYGGKIGTHYVDVRIDPENENIVWYIQGDGTNGNKVFKSTNQGSSWTNMSGSGPVSTTRLKYINIQGGTNGGVYVTDYDGKTYYIDNTMSDWIDYSNGKPLNFFARNGAQIFYSKNKLRMSGNRGILETPLYQKSKPVALPVTEKREVSCQNDTVYFGDQSIAQYDRLRYQWRFPGATWVSDYNSAYPKVTYGPGSHDVTLKITDKDGKSSTTTIKDMIYVGDYCTIDTVAGNMLAVPKRNYNVTTELGTTDINSDKFSISFWVKPHGAQNPLAQMLAIDKCPGSRSHGFGIGFAYKNNTKNLVPCYTDSKIKSQGTSNHTLDSTKWNNIVLTYTPNKIILYVNGWPEVLSTGPNNVLDFTNSPFLINFDLHRKGGHFTGWLDEVKFYNYNLSQGEVREKMHLIAKNRYSERGLVKYVQFNNYDRWTNTTRDLITGQPITIAGGPNYILPSSAPVATGKVHRIQNTINGKNSFTKSNTAIWWASGTKHPEGEVVSFELNSDPDVTPNNNFSAHPEKYYIVNNYGKNQTFSEPYYFLITGMNIDPDGFSKTHYELYKRDLGDYGQTWGSPLSRPSKYRAWLNNQGYLKFPGKRITTTGQFFIRSKYQTDPSFSQFPTVFCQSNDGSIALSWQIEDTVEATNFEILRSIDGQNFETIKTIAFRPGQTQYNYEDLILDGGRDFMHYYRLRYLDQNEETHYIEINEIDCGETKPTISLWPNPVRDMLSVNVGIDQHSGMAYDIIDVQGRTIKKGNIEANVRIIDLNLSDLGAGSYYFRLRDGSDPTLHKFVIIGK